MKVPMSYVEFVVDWATLEINASPKSQITENDHNAQSSETPTTKMIGDSDSDSNGRQSSSRKVRS